MELKKQHSTTSMPSILNLLVQDLAKEDKFYHIEMDSTGTVEELKCNISIASGLDTERQVLYYRQAVLKDDSKQVMKDCGIQNNDMINLHVSNLNQADQQLMQGFFDNMNKGSGPKLTQKQLFNQMFHNAQNMRIKNEVAKIKELWVTNSQNLKQQLEKSDPDLAAALVANDDSKMEKIIGERLKEQMDKQRAEKERVFKLQNADPDDVEAQKEIEEEIRKGLINNNYEQAMEMCPEFFGQITMLYIETKVNGESVQAFVDSGAQSTIISQACAKRCNIMHLVDTRFAGTAVGVGSSKILGRVHLAPLDVILDEETGKKETIQCSFTVLEDDKIDFLLGLDNLKRHQCCIDLVESKLHFNRGEFSVGFLPDGKIKRGFVTAPSKENSEAGQDQNKSAFDTEDLTGGDKQSGPQEVAFVKKFIEMGFDEAQIKGVIEACQGNLETAAQMLLPQ